MGLGCCWDVARNANPGMNADVMDGLEVDVGATECWGMFRLPQVGACHPHCHHCHFCIPPILGHCPWQR